MEPLDYLEAARVPKSVVPQVFAPWTIERRTATNDIQRDIIGWNDQTILWRHSLKTMHLEGPGEIVMEDSMTELMRHLPIWIKARGRVLVTGLGLGCVVRGLLASPRVHHIDVVEIDGQIIDVIGKEFRGHKRVAIHHGDALTFRFPDGMTWDYGWHDIWCDEDNLNASHVHLLAAYKDRCKHQGAWQLPRPMKRVITRAGLGLLGA